MEDSTCFMKKDKERVIHEWCQYERHYTRLCERALTKKDVCKVDIGEKYVCIYTILLRGMIQARKGNGLLWHELTYWDKAKTEIQVKNSKG